MTRPHSPHTWLFHQSALFILITCLLITHRTASEDDIITPRSWNHNFDIGMYFLEHPVSQILEKSETKAIIQCTAVAAITVSIRCADQSFLSDKSIPSVPVDGQSAISVSAEIDRNSIEKVREEGLPCVCEAKNLTSTLRSEPALLQIAHLKRMFREEPHPIQRVKIGESAEICAQPPEGVPEPTVYWEKDGKTLNPENEQSVLITRRPHNKHCLIFSLVTEDTQGSYRCVAQNLATNRTSLPSKLLVYLDGAWSDWSAWSECNITCGLGSSIRSRYCNQPTPINDGKQCVGDALETKQCTRLCQQDGNWSPWSEWNACNTQCVHHRTRKCNNPAPRNGGKDCVGETIDHANCSGGHCNQNYMSKNSFSGAPGANNGDPRGGSGSGPDGGSREGTSSGGEKNGDNTDDIFLYTFAMVTAMLLFVAIVMSGLFLCYKKYKYICRITGGSHTTAATAETSLCHHPHAHTLAMEAHHQQRSAASYSPSGLYVTKSHNGNIVTRVLGGTGAPPDVTQTQQTVQILSDGTFYKTMYVDPNIVAAVPSSGNGSLPPTSVAFLSMSEEGGTPPGSQQGYTPTSVVPPNKRCSPSRCSSTALYSKTDTAVSMLSDQSSVNMFCKSACGGGALGNEDMQMFPNGSGQPHHRMYENTGNHYQSIKDIDSDASHYHTVPFQNGPPPPIQSTNQKAAPIQPIIQIRQGVVVNPSDRIARHCAHQAAALGNINAGCLSPYQEESDYFSQCSSEGCSAGFANGFITESDCTTYHIDLCRSPISPENCITCNKSFH